MVLIHSSITFKSLINSLNSNPLPNNIYTLHYSFFYHLKFPVYIHFPTHPSQHLNPSIQREKMKTKMEKEEVRKGPWTEEEDVQLVFYVNLFGDRRWDFVAKVSGLKRTGKSCRLRWVNYLHPGLKRGKMTPNEERLVVELQSKWGNRWSRIARKLPGRTDNEIKNYWRTHMRKKAQERKKNKKGSSSSSSSSSTSSSSSSSNSSSSSAPTSPGPGESTLAKGKGVGAEGERSFYDTGGVKLPETGVLEVEEGNKVYSMDDLWKEFEFPEENYGLTAQAVASPIWDYCPTDSLWSMSEEERQHQPVGDHHFQSFPFYNYMID